MWRMIQAYKEGFETIALGDRGKKATEPIFINNEPHYIFKEHNLKHCSCVDKNGVNHVFWCGDADFECQRDLHEIEEFRLMWSKTFLCRQSGIIIIVLRGTEAEIKEHKYEYMNSVFD